MSRCCPGWPSMTESPQDTSSVTTKSLTPTGAPCTWLEIALSLPMVRPCHMLPAVPDLGSNSRPSGVVFKNDTASGSGGAVFVSSEAYAAVGRHFLLRFGRVGGGGRAHSQRARPCNERDRRTFHQQQGVWRRCVRSRALRADSLAHTPRRGEAWHSWQMRQWTSLQQRFRVTASRQRVATAP